ncbi:transposase, partial [Streptococcus pneumoniae]|uniref:transposase n=1 Tax=Streptococcus pneumoniae TaxID=1313 RepID=UPI001E6326E2
SLQTLCCKPHPVKMISSTLKIHPNSLYRWIQEYEKYDEVRSHDMGAHFVILNLRCSKMK